MSRNFSSRLWTLSTLVRRGEWARIQSIMGQGVCRSSVFHWSKLFIFRLNTLPHSDHTFENFSVRWATEEDLPKLCEIQPSANRFRTRFSRGCLCLMGQIGDSPVSMTWHDTSDWHISRPHGYQFEVEACTAWVLGGDRSP